MTENINPHPDYPQILLHSPYFIPRGAVHGFNNLKQTDAKALAVVTPALIGPNFFKESAAIVNAGGPPDIEKLKVVLAKHGLVAAMPQDSEHSGT